MPFTSVKYHRQDLCDENDERKTFIGKTILLCDDFRQILPVIPLESRGTLIENCVTSWHELKYESFIK